MAESHTQTAAGQLDPPPAFVAESGEVLYSNDAKIGPSAQDQSQNKQDTGPITASPTLFDSSTGGHNVSYQALDPTTWPKWKKRRVLFIVCAFYFLFTFITTVTVPTFNDLQTYFNISYAQVNYTVAVPALALGVSPFFWTPLAEVLGRRSAMILGCLLAFCASIGLALEKTYSGYMVFRFLQGWGVGPASTVGLQMLEDIYLEHERGQKVGYWCLAIDIGLLFGPLIGGFATLVSWNFPVWLTAIIFGVLLVAMLLFLPETGYPAKIPPYTIRQPNLPTDTSITIKPLPWLNLRTLPGTMNRPKPWDSTLRFLQLFAFPNVAVTIMFYCWTWYWFILCVITMLPGAYPDYNPQVQGLLFLGFIVGTLISELLFSGGLSDYLVRRAALKNNGERIPEKRLLLYFPAAILTTIGLVLFGCTVQLNWHWFIAQIATFLVGTGIQIGNTTTTSYVVDVYPEHVMDVTLFYSFHLNMSAFVSPFFIVPWIERIGWAWCFGVQGFIVIAGCLIFVPFLYIYGRKLRDWKGPIPWGIVEIS
ncbi:major facilitator superfamily transporter [Ceratobasidium sp. AG-Ba]|nr:major facilitator superfamily transporter [Ceratobasidium sp. AG-Ba]